MTKYDSIRGDRVGAQLEQIRTSRAAVTRYALEQSSRQLPKLPILERSRQ